MSGGPVIAADGKVVGAVCSSFRHSEAGEETSYASLVAPLLGLSANPTLEDPPRFESLWDLLERNFVRSDGTHRLYPRPESSDGM